MGYVPISVFRNCSGPNKIKKENKMAAPAAAPCPREKQVTITIDPSGKIKVVPDTFHVSKSGNEEVVWIYSGKFVVDFRNDSPFCESQFNDQFPFSGVVRRSVQPGPKRYKYTVTIPGYAPLDPDGQVDF